MDKIEAYVAFETLVVSINETDEAKQLWETVAWFATRSDAQLACDAFAGESALITIIEVPDRDWVRESLSGLAPVVAGRFYLYGSHDSATRRIGGVSLLIDAGTAFGTGHHGTTAGCLLAFDRILKKRRPTRVLDLGTGTGVLALAAASALKLKVLGSDIDAEAVQVSIRNAQLNGVGPLFKSLVATGLHHRGIGAKAPYDVIFANILARPLAQLATGLSRLLAPGGDLILSGLTVDQERWIRAAYVNQGLCIKGSIRNGNWIALVMGKKSGTTTLASNQSHAARGFGYAQDV